MFRTNHARRSLAAGAAFAALSLGAVAAAPGALAAPGTPTPTVGPTQTGGHTTLSVTGGTAVGLAGQPVNITEKITNTSSTEGENLSLDMNADAGVGMPENGLSIWYQADNGVWKLLSMDYNSGSFQGMLPLTINLAPSETRTVHLRFGLPMGEPHNGDSNGGATSVELTSSVGAADGSWALQARDIRTVKVQSITSRFTGVPSTAVPGGKYIEFRATVTNLTASNYINLSTVLFTNRYATVQVFRGGRWVTLPPVLTDDNPDAAGYYLNIRDYSAPIGSSLTLPMRISFSKNAPLGKTTVTQSVIANEGSTPFRGTYLGAAAATVTLVRGTSSSPTTSGSPTTSASPSPTATTSPSNSASPSTTSPTPSATTSASTGELAETGNDGSSTLLLSLGGATLLLAGGAVVAYVRMRRSA